MTRYKYTVVRYVPNVVRDEGVNVGVLVQGLEGRPILSRFVPRSAAVRKLWPSADAKLVRRFESQLKKSIKNEVELPMVGHPTDEGFFDALRGEFNGNLQVTEVRGLLADHPQAALQRLYETHVAEPGGGPRPINYQALAPFKTRQRLWSAFEKRDLVREDRFTEKFTLEGTHAPWVFDLGASNHRVHIINSVAFSAQTAEANLGRALVFKGMLDEVREVGKEQILPTAVIDEARDPTTGGFEEGLEIIKDAGANLVSLGQIDAFADQVASEFE